MLDALRREGDTSNTVIGIILLVMLLVFVGPGILPSLLARTFPFIDEGVPCTRLRTAEDRPTHQSLIGRSATDPLSIRTQLDPLPQDTNGTWTIRIAVINNTIGTVPFVFDENQVITGDDGTTGIGLIFTPQANVIIPGNTRQTGGLNSFPEDSIHLLGPRQRCIHRVEIPANQILNNPQIQFGSTTVTSYYRITGAGAITQPNAIFSDQGLDIIAGGIIESEPIPIPAPFGTN